jgi:ribosome-associated translation inhibitor RaiA
MKNKNFRKELGFVEIEVTEEFRSRVERAFEKVVSMRDEEIASVYAEVLRKHNRPFKVLGVTIWPSPELTLEEAKEHRVDIFDLRDNMELNLAELHMNEEIEAIGTVRDTIKGLPESSSMWLDISVVLKISNFSALGASIR